jgi:FHA domain-containing protein
VGENNTAAGKAMPVPDSETLSLSRSMLTEEEKRLLQAAREKLEREAKAHSTDRLSTEEKDAISLPFRAAFGLRSGEAKVYLPLPARLAKLAENPTFPRWRIELHGLGPDVAPLGLDICDDVIIGRGAGLPESPDLDFNPYQAFQMGISRHHMMLRPSKNQLYMIDLHSTNGTFYNSLRLSSGKAQPLLHGDTIGLGKLTFSVKIITSPNVPA